MADINLLRETPEIIRESQRRRFASVDLVDEIIKLNDEWRRGKYELDGIRNEYNKLNKEVAKLKKSGEEATEQIQQIEIIKQRRIEKEKAVDKLFDDWKEKLATVGNVVHDSVVISNDEANNSVIKTYGEPWVPKPDQKLKNHVDLGELLGVDTKRGAKVAGARAYILTGFAARFKRALLDYALDFLIKRGFEENHTPYFMNKDVMPRCAQLSQFDEELYKVIVEEEDKTRKVEEKSKYLIATAEQPLCAMHQDEWIHPTELPKRYAGYSTCFRKEAGAHGRDTLGIFRVHQFDKVEQFCFTSPDDSWAMFEEMIKTRKIFTKMYLKIPYRVVSIVSGALNDAAAKKYDLEGWFPASGKYRELVSCSNCTDYQARRLEIRHGYKTNDNEKKYVHTLNSTLTAIERTMCCIFENYQREDGMEIPEVLQPYMGIKFQPFQGEALPAKMPKTKWWRVFCCT